MHTERLRELAEVVLPPVAEEEFDLARWKCGTVACAIGHAASYPPFNAQGFTLEKSNHVWSEDLLPVFAISDTGKSYGWDAVCDFFRINDVDASWLFSIASYDEDKPITKQMVIDRVLSVVAAS